MRVKGKQKQIYSTIEELNPTPPAAEPVPQPVGEPPGNLSEPEEQTRPAMQSPAAATALPGAPQPVPAAPLIEAAPPEPAPSVVQATMKPDLLATADIASTASQLVIEEVSAAAIEPERVVETPLSQAGPPEWSVDTETVFGLVRLGDFEDRNLTVANKGSSDLVITELSGLPAAGFSLLEPPGLPLCLGPGDLQVFSMRFAPDSPGIKTAALTLSLDRQTAASRTILCGTGARAVETPYGTVLSPVVNSLDMTFVFLGPGVFLMGSPEDEPGRKPDEIQHEVTLTRGFYLQTTPVTQKQWLSLMEHNPSRFAAEAADCPVEGVSWKDCQEFIHRLNLREEGIYRLPTEAEWEYACRAGNAAALTNGEIARLFCDRDVNLDRVAWYCGNSGRTSHPVGLKDPNAWGLYDLHGNVWEWCQDWYSEYAANPVTDPMGPPAGQERVVRGGSWFSSAKNCRSACRSHWSSTSRSHYLGFRLVREAG